MGLCGRGAGLTVAVVTVALLATACDGEDVVDPHKHEQARTDVLAAGTAVIEDLAQALGGRSKGRGSFRGCGESATGDVDQLEYEVTGRIDPGSSAPQPLLAAARPALEAAGFTAITEVDVPQGRSVWGTQGDLSAAITERQGRPWLILSVHGPCLNFDEDPRNEHDAPDEIA